MYATCAAHVFPRESCPDCAARRVPPTPREVPAETLLRMKMLYPLRGDADRSGFRLRTAAQVLDELIAECEGEVQT